MVSINPIIEAMELMHKMDSMVITKFISPFISTDNIDGGCDPTMY